MMEDGNQSSDTRSDSKQLYNRILSHDFLTLLEFWNKILIRIDRVQKRLQDPSMNFHNAALDLKALRENFNDERELLVGESIEEGLRLCTEWNVETERRTRRKKLMAGESTRDAGLTAKEELERVMKGTIDRLQQEMNDRFVRLLETDDKFGFLLDIEALCYGSDDSEEMKKKCKNLSEFYASDVNGQNLYEENKENKKLTKPEEILQFIVQ